MKFVNGLLILLSFVLAGTAQARTCGCVADVFSKAYQENKKTFYGSIRKWSCEYTCYSDDEQVKITAFHADWYVGKDTGREGVCDGVKIRKVYNNFFQDFIWTPDEKGSSFHPRTSTSPTLKAWAQENCE